MPDAEPPILSAATARKRFILYFALKLTGLGAMFGGVLLSRGGGLSAASVILLLVGAASLFVRPRMLGLTTRPER